MKKIHKKFIYTEFGQETYDALYEFLPYDYVVIHDIDDEYIDEQIRDRCVMKRLSLNGVTFTIYTGIGCDYIVNVDDKYYMCTYKNEND